MKISLPIQVILFLSLTGTHLLSQEGTPKGADSLQHYLPASAEYQRDLSLQKGSRIVRIPSKKEGRHPLGSPTVSLFTLKEDYETAKRFLQEKGINCQDLDKQEVIKRRKEAANRRKAHKSGRPSSKEDPLGDPLADPDYKICYGRTLEGFQVTVEKKFYDPVTKTWLPKTTVVFYKTRGTEDDAPNFSRNKIDR